MIQHLENNGFLRLKQILKLIPVSRSTWWRGVKAGRYPQSIQLGPKITVWRTIEIKALLDQLVAGTRDNGGDQ